ncbi:hypothetical protein ACJJTC_001684 [Scirpophaga incertulas]
MSTDPDNNVPSPNVTEIEVSVDCSPQIGAVEDGPKDSKKSRGVSFPDDDQLVTQYFEPSNPWPRWSYPGILNGWLPYSNPPLLIVNSEYLNISPKTFATIGVGA